ncbi:MAG: DUF5788 family protein [Thermoplasmata archaeon]
MPERISSGDTILTTEERERILDRAHSVFSWVGNLIPERENLDGIMINLRETVFALRTKKDISDADRQLAHVLIQKIKSRKKELEEHLGHDELTKDTAMALLDEISGLVKAINDLHDIEFAEDLDIKKAEIMNRVDDEKRWQEYLRRLKLGK